VTAAGRPTPRAFAFDLDDTLAPSKAALDDAAVAMLDGLLASYDVCVISGGTYAQFRSQVVARMPASDRWRRLHLMPTSGSSYYRWDGEGWTRAYAEQLPPAQRDRVFEEIEAQARRLGVWESEVWGERVEDRGTQVTFSALGQQAPLDRKRAWDPDGSKRARLRDALQPLFPDLEVRSGGSTSVDVTRRGVDKAFGVARFLDLNDLAPAEVVFFGDRLDPGGNDYPVTTLGVQCIPVEGPADTRAKVRDVLAEAGTAS
jgi:HAD superfamily hydrolase (TIGR01484 family)